LSVLVCNVEIKGCSTRDPTLVVRVARELHRSEAGQALVLSSFDPGLLAQARVLAVRHPAAMLIGASSGGTTTDASHLLVREWAARAMCASALHVDHRLCSPENVRRWRGRGLAVAAWTVDDPADVERCCAAGVDAVITNRPAATLACMERLGVGD